MGSEKRLRLRYGELVLQPNCIAVRWERFKHDYLKICQELTFIAKKNPSGEVFLKQYYIRIGRAFDSCFGKGAANIVFGHGKMVGVSQVEEFIEKFEPLLSEWLKEDFK